jgi:hypothetical protein
MTFTPQNFVNQVGPAVSAVWLNGVDVTVNFVLNGAQTVAAAQAALGITPITLPLGIAEGGTGETAGTAALQNLGANQAYIGGQLYPRTAAEDAALITPTNDAYPTLNILRYGGDNTGTTDNTTAFNALFAVLLQLNGGSAVIPPGTYNLNTSITTTLIPSSGASAFTHGVNLYAYGALVNFTGSGFAFDFTSVEGGSAYQYQPNLSIFGMNIGLTSAASGGIRQKDMCSSRYYDVFVLSTSQTLITAAGFTQTNVTQYSENNHYVGCGVVTCTTGIQFIETPGAQQSMARTLVRDFFGAGIGSYWFDIGAGVDMYDSVFENIKGNFGSIAYFGVGSSSGGANMGGTTIYPILAEWNGNPNSYAQCIVRLRDYPNTSGTDLRPTLYEPCATSQITLSGTIPIWAGGSSNTSQTVLPGPESIETQGLGMAVPFNSTYGQSSLFETGPNGQVYAVRNAATANNAGFVYAALTGFASNIVTRWTMVRSGYHATIMVYDALAGTSTSTGMTLIIANPEFMPYGAPGYTIQVPCIVENNGNSTTPAIASFAPASTYASIAFTGNPPVEAVSGTLSANWTDPDGIVASGSGVYLGVFNDGEVRPVTLTVGAATCTWSSPLTAAQTSTALTIQCVVVTFSVATAFATYSTTGFTGTKGIPVGTCITYPLVY